MVSTALTKNMGVRNIFNRFMHSARATGLGGSMWNSRAGLGAIAGGIYGGMSDNGSILGGAVKGAALAQYGGAFLRGGMTGYRNIANGGLHGIPYAAGMRGGRYGASQAANVGYNAMHVLGGGGISAFMQANRDGIRSGRFIRKSITKAWNGISTSRAGARIRGML